MPNLDINYYKDLGLYGLDDEGASYDWFNDEKADLVKLREILKKSGESENLATMVYKHMRSAWDYAREEEVW